jgi:bifunctional non-homologous end joining protein LigD
MPKRSLDTYRRKRDPDRTPEPVPPPGPLPKGNDDTFVIQEHHATALHWDFRLERDGVLVSWALPKGLPLDPKDNHLAVPTEDHPIEYASFEGDIAHGEYGGGQVILWDRGTYETEKWDEREVKIVVHGRRSEGRYVLFSTGKNWMVHRMDPPPEGYERMPRDLRPMVASPNRRLPRAGVDWAFEFRWSGLRVLVRVDGGRPETSNAGGADVTASFPELRELAESLGARQMVLDGVLIGTGANGHPVAEPVHKRLAAASSSTVRRLRQQAPLTFMAVDVLHLDGRSLLDQPYDARRKELARLGVDGPAWHESPVFDDGRAVQAAAAEQGLRGIVAKRRHSPYRPGETTDDWREITRSG